jgi:hypothetical protein
MARLTLGLTASLVFSCALLMTACNATSTSMHHAGHGAIVGAPNAATVVFVRPSEYKGEDKTTILDSHGRFLGDSLAGSYFAVRVAPGRNVFVSCAANTSALEANLTAGRIYFVEVSVKPGFMHTRFHLLAVRPGAPSWKKLDTWMTESAAFLPDEQAGQRGLSSTACARGAPELLDDYSPDERRARTLGPRDGR